MSDVMFTTSRRELLAGITWAAEGLPARPNIPVLAGMRLDVSLGTVTASGFDYGTTCRAHTRADVTAAGSVLPYGHELVKAVKSLPGGKDAVVVAMSGDGMLTLECEGVSAAVELLPMDDYPELPKLPAEAAVVAGDVFAASVARVAVAACTDGTLPAICAVHFTFSETSATLAATDRYRLAVDEIPLTLTSGDYAKRDMTIPAKILAAYAKVAGKDGKVTMHLGEDLPERSRGFGGEGAWAGFSDGERELILRASNGDFPKYRQLLPKSFAASAGVDAVALGKAVKTAGGMIGKNTALKLKFYRDAVTVIAEKDGNVVTSQTVPCDLDLPAGEGHRPVGFTIGFNPEYLGSLLAAVKGAARLAFSAPGKPVQITAEGSGPWRGLLCPIKLAG